MWIGWPEGQHQRLNDSTWIDVQARHEAQQGFGKRLKTVVNNMVEKSNDNVTWTHFWAFLGVLIVLLGVAFGAAFAVGRYAMDMQQQALERHDAKDVHPGAVRKDYYELDMRHLKEDIQNSRDIMIKKFKEVKEEQVQMHMKIEANKERINSTSQNILSQLQDIKKKIKE